MDWKDTVMSNLALAIMNHPDLPMGQAIAIDQAEISFKLGQEEEAKGGHNSISYLEGEQDGYKKGISKVVETYKAENLWLYEKYKPYWEHLVEKLCGKPS